MNGCKVLCNMHAFKYNIVSFSLSIYIVTYIYSFANIYIVLHDYCEYITDADVINDVCCRMFYCSSLYVGIYTHTYLCTYSYIYLYMFVYICYIYLFSCKLMSVHIIILR